MLLLFQFFSPEKLDENEQPLHKFSIRLFPVEKQLVLPFDPYIRECDLVTCQRYIDLIDIDFDFGSALYVYTVVLGISNDLISVTLKADGAALSLADIADIRYNALHCFLEIICFVKLYAGLEHIDRSPGIIECLKERIRIVIRGSHIDTVADITFLISDRHGIDIR